MPRKPAILFVVDSGAEIGGGHVMRSLTLARALADLGCSAAFLASGEGLALVERFGGAGIGRLSVADPDPAALTRAAAGAFDLIVFDHYRLDAAAHAAIRNGRPAVAIDERLNRALDVDLVIDASPGDAPHDLYAELAPRAQVLYGPAFALVRPEFAALRAGAMARRATAHAPPRLLIALGLTDVGGVTAKIADRLMPRRASAPLDVVVGRSAPSLPRLRVLADREPDVTVHVETLAMADLTARADLAIGAGGSSAWERCVLGLASVCLTLADNQAPYVAALQKAGAAEGVDMASPRWEADFDRAFLGLLSSFERRRRMGSAAAALCDGMGARRVADAVLAL